MYLGDYIEDGTLYFQFTTTSAGVPFTLAGVPVLSVYKDNNVAQSVAGVTLLVDHDAGVCIFADSLHNILLSNSNCSWHPSNKELHPKSFNLFSKQIQQMKKYFKLYCK